MGFSTLHTYSALLKEQSTPDLRLEYGRVLSWMGASKASVDQRHVLADPPEQVEAVADRIVTIAHGRVVSDEQAR